jgi:hypothetical protein
MKFLIILLIAWSFVFSGQKTFARDTAIVLPPTPIYTAMRQRAITEKGDTARVLIQTYINEQNNYTINKNRLEDCDIYCHFGIILFCVVGLFLLAVCMLYL